MTTPHQRAAEDAARHSYGKLLALIATRTGDIAGAEDALADAFASALTTWPRDGIPDRPEAWLLTTARRRLIDAQRRAQRIDLTDIPPEMPALDAHDQAFPDDRLRLMFVCAHPAVDAGLRTPLMLQTVLGLEADQIAQAYLVSPSAMAQRLVRVKRKIKDARIPFADPDTDALHARRADVFEAVYGAHAIDWLEGPGDLSQEALFLARLLARLMPDDAEALGLCALVCLVTARRAARVIDGVLVPPPDQDTTLWDGTLLDEGEALLRRAQSLSHLGRFQLEAAIQSVHTARRRSGHTDWRGLSQLYAGLVRFAPTIGAAVSRAAVVGEDAGAQAGLDMLDLVPEKDWTGFQPAWAVRAHLLAQSGDIPGSMAAYDRAIALSDHAPTIAFLKQRKARLMM